MNDPYAWRRDRGSLIESFYTTERCGALRLSDGGGPFGFDITVALQIDHLIAAYGCDGIVETGTFLGDTTSYLARRYRTVPVRSIEVDDACVAFARRRLAGLDHCDVIAGDSAVALPAALADLKTPLVYLAAHWREAWPLEQELRAIRRGIVCIDDFDIGHPRFGFDAYNGTACGVDFVSRVLLDADELFVGNPFVEYGVPCLQVGRRTGTAYVPRCLDPEPLATSSWFVRVPLRDGRRRLPSWPELPDHLRPERSR